MVQVLTVRKKIIHKFSSFTAWGEWSAIRQANFLTLSVALRGLQNPLSPPGRRFEGIP
jgi:hypothetical protein